jgi:hypothetical protein
MTSSIEPMSCRVVSRSRRVIVLFLTAVHANMVSMRKPVTWKGRDRGRTGKVERDAERRAELVVTGVPLANRRVRVVDAGRDAEAAELLRDLGDERLELGVGGERDDEALDGGDGGRKRQDAAVDVVGAGPERVFEEGVEDAADTEGGLDDVGDELADCVEARQLWTTQPARTGTRTHPSP